MQSLPDLQSCHVVSVIVGSFLHDVSCLVRYKLPPPTQLDINIRNPSRTLRDFPLVMERPNAAESEYHCVSVDANANIVVLHREESRFSRPETSKDQGPRDKFSKLIRVGEVVGINTVEHLRVAFHNSLNLYLFDVKDLFFYHFNCIRFL